MEKTDKRRYSLFAKTLKSCVEPALRPVLKAKGAAASKLMVEWNHIVGNELAAHTLPLKIAFAKDKNAEGILTIACDGAYALELQHMQPIIIERIAAYFGYRAVSRITIEQRQVSGTRPTRKAKKYATKKVDDTGLAQVEDADLKAALSGLAKTISGHTL